MKTCYLKKSSGGSNRNFPTIKDEELKEAQGSYPIVRSKEELYYFKIFTEHFGTGKAVETVGQWIRL